MERHFSGTAGHRELPVLEEPHNEVAAVMQPPGGDRAIGMILGGPRHRARSWQSSSHEHKKATDDALLAETMKAAEKNNAEALKHRADSVEDEVRYLKAKQHLAAVSQELARENVMGATHLAGESLAEVVDALNALGPITSRGPTATTVLAAPDESPPDVD